MKRIRPNPANKPLSVFFVAKHKMVQESFKLLIESTGEFVVSATGCLGDDFERSDFPTDPDVAVVYMAGDECVKVVPDLLHALPDLRIVVVVAGENLELQAMALELGAVGIVHEEQHPGSLIEGIKQAYAGDTWLNRVLLNKVMRRNRPNGNPNARRPGKFDADSGAEVLTKRELEVLGLIGQGLRNRQIAERLLISEPTVRCHLSTIYGKLGVDDRLNLVIKAYQLGLLEITQTTTDLSNPALQTEQV
jgi:DNA-binding NarL/FixJ family response regulator